MKKLLILLALLATPCFGASYVSQNLGEAPLDGTVYGRWLGRWTNITISGGSLAWTNITSTPTTRDGYGITDVPLYSDLLPDAPTNALTYGRGNGGWKELTVTNITGLTDKAPYKSAAQFYIETEFLGATATEAGRPWGNTAFSSGTTAILSAETNHFGILRQASAGANSGVSTRLSDSPTAILLGGGEYFECVAAFDQTNSAIHWIGFVDANSSTESTDGIYFEQINGYVRGKTAAGASRSTTTTSNLVAIAPYYRFRGSLSDDRLTATFQLFNESRTLLWSDTLTNNLPTGSGNLTSMGAVSYHTSGTSNLLKIDFMCVGRTNAYR